MFIDLLKRRRSVRRFSEKALAPREIRDLVTAALLSPSSRRIDPWEFVVVTERPTLEKLSRSKRGAEFLAGAGAGIVVLGNRDLSDMWIEDCAIAASNILLAAADRGLGACWAQIRLRESSSGTSAEDHVRSVLSVPQHFAVEAVIGVGYPAEEREPLTEADADHGKVHFERYSP